VPNEDIAPVAIVTGAGRGLGREHALALARAGWSVVVNDLGGAGNGIGADATPAQSVVAEIEALGGKAVADGADISNWNAAGALIQKAVDTFGRLDGLVNNAGVLRDRTLANFTEEDWDISVAVNLKGTAAPMHHAARYWRDLAKQTGGTVLGAIVNTSSASGLYGNPGQGNYAASKLGVTALTLVAARELERYGIRVNAVAPVASTRLTESVMSQEAKDRFDPSLVSPLVVYLLSEQAAGITGRVFEMGAGSVVAVEMAHPGVGMRAADGLWTVADLARVVPGLVAQLQPQDDSRSAGKFMSSAPLDRGA
jgi:NAD(P)-dependent dehydrogenase (short-subunit alcohol dehydrogenase family)